MDARAFAGLFERHVAEPAATVGFEPWGKSLWLEQDGFRAAVLRTELRHTWPFALTLAIGHTCLRDFHDRLPPPRSRNVDEYPVKARPSEAKRLARSFRYVPCNLSHWPADTFSDRRAERQLRRIGRSLVAGIPVLRQTLTPEVMLRQLIEHGEGAWCEQRWIEDYRRALTPR